MKLRSVFAASLCALSTSAWAAEEAPAAGSTPLDLGVLRFEMSGEYEITHYYGLTPTPLSDSLAILFPDYLGALPPIGEDLSDQFRGTVCLDPVVLPVAMEATID
jgi:hypothetical protein